jgi:hypothetical protein
MKIGVFVIEKQTIFLPYWLKCLKTFLLDKDYVFNVVNNAENLNNEKDILDFCINNNINHYVNTNKNFLTASHSHGHALNYTLHNLIIDSNYDIVAVIDSDMFLSIPLSIEEFMKDYDVAAVPQSRSIFEYFWGNLLMIKVNESLKELDLNCGAIENVGVDVGGLSYHYIKKYNPKWKIIGNTCLIAKQFNNLSALPKEFLEDYKDSYALEVLGPFVHYRNGSNWAKFSEEYHREKRTYVFKCIDNLIKNKTNNV